MKVRVGAGAVAGAADTRSRGGVWGVRGGWARIVDRGGVGGVSGNANGVAGCSPSAERMVFEVWRGVAGGPASPPGTSAGDVSGAANTGNRPCLPGRSRRSQEKLAPARFSGSWPAADHLRFFSVRVGRSVLRCPRRRDGGQTLTPFVASPLLRRRRFQSRLTPSTLRLTPSTLRLTPSMLSLPPVNLM